MLRLKSFISHIKHFPAREQFRAVNTAAKHPVIAVIAAPQTEPSKTALAKFPGGAELIIGNDSDTLLKHPRIKEALGLLYIVPGNQAAMTSVIDDLPNLKWVHSFFAGVDALSDFINAKLISRSDIPLSNGRGAFSDSLGEWSLAAALHFNKQVPRVMDNRKAKHWEKFIIDVMDGKTIGFVGWGHIAKTTAKKFKGAFGNKIIALRRNPQSNGDGLADEIFGLEDKLEVFRRSDVVICSLPGTAETLNFCGAEEFRAMPQDSVFISIGRGTVVDEDALCTVLKNNHLRGAALDVFKVEPLPKESPLWDCQNLLLTAHNADLTDDYFLKGWEVWKENLDAVLGGRHLVTPVDKRAGY